MQELSRHIKHWLKPVALGGAVCLSIGHHTFNYWELPAPVLLLLFLFLLPLGGVGLHLLGKRIPLRLSQLSRTQLRLYLIGALLTSAFITWRTFDAPNSFQTITITPNLSQSQAIGLLELKANGNVVPLRQTALQNNWEEVDGVLYAKQTSQPITVSFKCPAGAPISLLFETTPQSGRIHISFGYETRLVDPGKDGTGNLLIQFTARYRGIPNWIFIPALILIDVITFGIFILFLLLVQELGQVFVRNSSTTSGDIHPHTSDLPLLLILGIVIHLINILSVPLLLDADSPAFLQGAVHLLEHGNLDGVSRLVGPGSTFLFSPIMFLFGRNAWGMKILLHMIALGCIPICYRLGWQISHNRWVALLSGLALALNPDIYFYSNYVMSDVANIFFVLLFSTLLLSALETLKPGWVFASLLTSSFAALLRSENILLLVIGSLALAAAGFEHWFRDHSPGIKKTFVHIGLAILTASLPVLWWSGHNLRVHNFFGLSNYMGVVLYDGWVYFGDASKLDFSDPSSSAVQELEAIAQRYPIAITDKSGVATGWETYPALIQSGYTDGQAIGLLRDAALDSIKKNPGLTLQLLFLKFRTGLRPEITHQITYPLPGEPAWTNAIKLQFFDAENLSITPLIRLQQKVNELVALWYPHLYPTWVLFCILVLTLSVLRRPTIHWMVLVAIVATRIFIPLTMSVPFWRYTVSGWMLLQIITIAWVWLFLNGAKALFKPGSTPRLKHRIYTQRKG